MSQTHESGPASTTVDEQPARPRTSMPPWSPPAARWDGAWAAVPGPGLALVLNRITDPIERDGAQPDRGH